MTTPESTFGARFWGLNENLASANFAMVMSTGIVSVALHLLGFQDGAMALFWINIAMFVVLWPLYLLKLVRFP
ncbi:MAG: C4-dicarboxylate ABC transporter, partial [Desulfovibrio sp.]|nr:C4-dicarboxylate ABC transporter [Desulfovibrio sp.]